MPECGGTEAASPSEGLDLSDRHLAKLARGGNGQAFDLLTERHHDSIYRLCRSMLGDGSDADDATQETFVRAFRSIWRYDPTRDFSPWLRGIAGNVCLQSLRRRSRDSRREVSLDAQTPEPVAPDTPKRSKLAEDALAALMRLDVTYRLPLALFYLEDGSVAEVADALEISPGAARVRLHRGREKLRNMLMEKQSEVNDDEG